MSAGLACLLRLLCLPCLLDGMSCGFHFSCLGRLCVAFWRPWGYPGHRLGPGLAQELLNGLECTAARAGALFYQDPGIQVTAKVEGDLPCLDPVVHLTTAGYKDLSIQNCMIQDSGRKL